MVQELSVPKLYEIQHKLSTQSASFKELGKVLHQKKPNKHVSNSEKESSHSTPHKIRLRHYFLMTFLFCALIWSMIALVHIESHKCKIDHTTLDHCARQLLFFTSAGDQFPRTNHELDHYCHAKRDSLKCLRHYVDSCLETNHRQRSYFGKYASQYKKQLDRTCLHHEERQKFINHSACLSELDLIRNATTCIDLHQNQLLYIAENVAESQKVSAACCSLHLRHHCFLSHISRKCKRKAQRYLMDQIEGPFRSVVKSLCPPRYLSVRGCRRSIEPALWHRIFEKPETLVRKVHSKSDAHRNDHSDRGRSLNARNQSVARRNSEEEKMKTKIVELKFQESFLAFFIITRKS